MRDLHFGPEPKPVYKDRVYFFAESAEYKDIIPTSMHSMLDWVLQFSRKPNRNQPVSSSFNGLLLVRSFAHSLIRS